MSPKIYFPFSPAQFCLVFGILGILIPDRKNGNDSKQIDVMERKVRAKESKNFYLNSRIMMIRLTARFINEFMNLWGDNSKLYINIPCSVFRAPLLFSLRSSIHSYYPACHTIRIEWLKIFCYYRITIWILLFHTWL